MPTPRLKSFDEMREGFRKHIESLGADPTNFPKTTDDFAEFVTSYWLNAIRERDVQMRLMIEGLKRIPSEPMVQIPCPDGRDGCLVYHTKGGLNHGEICHNSALDQALSMIKEK